MPSDDPPLLPEPGARRRPARELAVFLVLALIALGLRLHQLDRESLFMDEIRQVGYYGESFAQLVTSAATQLQPPLDYWIGKLASMIARSDFFVRLPAALFGTASVCVLWLSARRAAGLWPATAVAAIYSVLPFSIYYAQEARPYAIATCLVLVVMALVDRLLRNRRVRTNDAIALLLASYLFLLSRALAPLMVVAAIGAVLCVWLVIDGLRMERRMLPARTPAVVALACLAAATLLCLPFMLLIRRVGATYTRDTAHAWMSAWWTGARHFDPRAAWDAYAAQMDPLGVVLAAPLLAGIFLGATGHAAPQGVLLARLVALVMPLAWLADLYFFQAVTGFPYRPPYPVYLLPLALILVAVFLRRAGQVLAGRLGERPATATAVMVAIAVGLWLGATLVDFKTLQKKPDWRALSRYLENRYGPDQLLFFDSLSLPGSYKPHFLGFPRYYHGASPQVPMNKVIAVLDRIARSSLEPVLILFHYDDYWLTRRSRVPVMANAGGVRFVPLTRKIADERLQIAEFKGFSVVSLRHAHGNLALDTLGLLGALADALPTGPELLDVYVAGALVASVCAPERVSAFLGRARQVGAGSWATVLGEIEQRAAGAARAIPAAPVCGRDEAAGSSGSHADRRTTMQISLSR